MSSGACDVLPHELIEDIVTWNFKVYKHCVRKLPLIAREPQVQAIARRKFLRIETVDGITRYVAGGRLHRVDGPARFCKNGCGVWYLRGRVGRYDDAPSIYRVRPCNICDGDIEILYNIYGTVYEHTGMKCAWIVGDRIYRKVGPSMITTGGAEHWLKRGEYHRLDGPCIVCPNGCRAWATHGNFGGYDDATKPGVDLNPNCDDCRIMLTVKLLGSNTDIRIDAVTAWFDRGRISRQDDLPAIIAGNGDRYWLSGGLIHRANGPAIVYANGQQEWFQNGMKHRDGDQPASIHPNGQMTWFQNGLEHRDGGPAYIHPNGVETWFQHGKKHRDGDLPAMKTPVGLYWLQNGEYNRDYGPSVVADDYEIWHQDGVIHRMDGPAYIQYGVVMEFLCNGMLSDTEYPSVIRNDKLIWYRDGVIHRDDGPAMVCKAGCKHWYRYGVELFTFIGTDHLSVNDMQA